MSQNKLSSAKCKPPEKKKRAPRKITETYLHNAGLYYLQRFAASSAHFRDVMLRKVKKSCFAHKDQDFTTCSAMVDDLVRKFEASGLLNDEAYTQGLVTSMRRRGKSRRAIIAGLKSKGLDADLITRYLTEFDHKHSENETQAELLAALVFARKKKLGPFRARPDALPEKELGALARAGFSYDTSRCVFDMDFADAEALIHSSPIA